MAKIRSLVVDAGPGIALVSIGQLSGLKFDNAHLVVQLPNARLMPPEVSTIAELQNLGAGELHVLAYAETHGAAALLDDLVARKFARRNGIDVLGTLALLLLAKDQGHIDAVAPLINAMRAGGYRLADGLVLAILRAAGEE